MRVALLLLVAAGCVSPITPQLPVVDMAGLAVHFNGGGPNVDHYVNDTDADGAVVRPPH